MEIYFVVFPKNKTLIFFFPSQNFLLAESDSARRQFLKYKHVFTSFLMFESRILWINFRFRLNATKPKTRLRIFALCDIVIKFMKYTYFCFLHRKVYCSNLKCAVTHPFSPEGGGRETQRPFLTDNVWQDIIHELV